MGFSDGLQARVAQISPGTLGRQVVVNGEGHGVFQSCYLFRSATKAESGGGILLFCADQNSTLETL